MSEPFAITTISAPVNGELGLCPLPGRTGNPETDLETIADWNPALVVSLTEPTEMSGGAEHLARSLAARQIAWSHLPIADFGVPEESRDLWPELDRRIHSLLDDNGRVLVHCRGGRGRSGMIVLRILIERGENPGDALKRLRTARPGAVETDQQLRWATGNSTPPMEN